MTKGRMTNPFTDATSLLSRERDLKLRLDLVEKKLSRTRILIAFMIGLPLGILIAQKGLQ